MLERQYNLKSIKALMRIIAIKSWIPSIRFFDDQQITCWFKRGNPPIDRFFHTFHKVVIYSGRCRQEGVDEYQVDHEDQVEDCGEEEYSHHNTRHGLPRSSFLLVLSTNAGCSLSSKNRKLSQNQAPE